MSRCPPGRDDAARIVAANGRYDEQNDVEGHADIAQPFLAILDPIVDRLESVGIFQSADGISEVDAVLAPVLDGLGTCPTRRSSP
jgi:hypothetical protein